MENAIIKTGIFNDDSREIELTSEFSIHVHDVKRNPRFLFDGNIVETMTDREGKATMVRVEPDGRHRTSGYTGGLWISVKDIRFHNGGGWIADLAER